MKRKLVIIKKEIRPNTSVQFAPLSQGAIQMLNSLEADGVVEIEETVSPDQLTETRKFNFDVPETYKNAGEFSFTLLADPRWGQFLSEINGYCQQHGILRPDLEFEVYDKDTGQRINHGVLTGLFQ